MLLKTFHKLVTADLKKWGLHSDSAVKTICMATAHESGLGKYRKQLGGGPALGLQQIEPTTHDSIWTYSDTIRERAREFGILRDLNQLENDDSYSIWVARHYLLMDVDPLPVGDIATALYCKSYWNRTGKATAEEYLRDYWSWCSQSGVQI
jgi:hypothetical protein